MIQGRKTVYLLFSETDSRYRFKAARFAAHNGFIPTYPKIVNDFFENVNTKNASREDLIRKADEIWIFGKLNASMQNQLVTAKQMNKAIKYFSVYRGEFLEAKLEDLQA